MQFVLPLACQGVMLIDFFSGEWVSSCVVFNPSLTHTLTGLIKSLTKTRNHMNTQLKQRQFHKIAKKKKSVETVTSSWLINNGLYHICQLCLWWNSSHIVIFISSLQHTVNAVWCNHVWCNEFMLSEAIIFRLNRLESEKRVHNTADLLRKPAQGFSYN